MKSDKLIIIGAGGQGKVCLDIALKMGQWSEVFFLDNNKSTSSVMRHRVLHNDDMTTEIKETSDFFVAIGDNEKRKEQIEKLLANKLSVATLIHPKSIINSYVTIGVGSVVMAGSVINPDSIIGKGCIINTSATVDHDCIISDYVHLSPGVNVAGNVEIGSETWIGMGSQVVNNTKVKQKSFYKALSLIKNEGVKV